MKVGDLVRNTIPMRTNPVVHSPHAEIARGTFGVVVRINPEVDLVSERPMVDVVMETRDGSVHCGGYAEGFFEVVTAP